MKKILGLIGAVCIVTNGAAVVTSCVPGSLYDAGKVDLNDKRFQWTLVGKQLIAINADIGEALYIIESNLHRVIPMAQRNHDYKIWKIVDDKLSKVDAVNKWSEIMLEATDFSNFLISKVVFSQ